MLKRIDVKAGITKEAWRAGCRRVATKGCSRQYILFGEGESPVRKTTLIVVFLWLVATAVTGLAQVDTGTVVGTIKDASGAVVPNATATATNLDTGIKTAVKSASDGNYVITPVKIGRYSISAEAAGFRTEVRQNIVLDVQQTIRLDFSLRVGSVTETTNVTGDAPLLDTQDASLGDVVASQQIEQLPLNGRRYTDLATLTTGVAKITEGPVDGSSSPTNGNAGGSFAVNGTRGDQNNFILDGIDNNSNDNGDLSILSSVDAVAEFKVQTSNYSAEFGRSGGGAVNATTKSGTNRFHGSAWEFLRNEALDAAQYGFGTAQPKAPHKQNQFGVTLGGPIVKEKVFFFGDYEGTRIHSAQTDIATVPTQKETTGDFSDLLNPLVQTGLDGLGRPIYQGEIYNPSTTRTAPDGSTVGDGFGLVVRTGLPI